MTATPVLEGSIYRRFDAALEIESDGRSIIGRCCPYDVVADVEDGGALYREVIRHGAFRKVAKAPNRVPLNFEHRTDLGSEIGRAVELEERDDGLYGTFRAHDSMLGEHGLSIIRSGAVRGLSIAAVLHPAGSRLVDGVVERRLLLLDHVAVTSSPSYPGAEVTTIRSGQARPGIAETLARQAQLRARSAR